MASEHGKAPTITVILVVGFLVAFIVAGLIAWFAG
jgi:hypothetical protein